jgi:DNA uptake protein ComE-like DNA-binding protein
VAQPPRARGGKPGSDRPARPGRPQQKKAPRSARAWFRGKAWLLLAVIPFGLTTWAAFVYIGIRARRPRWLAWAGVYAALLAAYLAIDSTAGKNNNNAAAAVGAFLAVLAWIGGGVHAFAISGDAARRIEARTDTALDAARLRIERRAEGRRLAARRPALAKEVGLGRPDIPGADDYGLVDVNHAAAAALTRMPGVTDEVAGRIADLREQVGGFSSVDDLGLVLDLPANLVDRIRDTAIFLPDSLWPGHCPLRRRNTDHGCAGYVPGRWREMA